MAVVIVVAVAGGVLGKSGESRAGRIKVETVEASLETTAPPETSGEPASIVLETTLSAEEIAEKEHDEAGSRRSWTVMQTWGSPGYPAI